MYYVNSLVVVSTVAAVPRPARKKSRVMANAAQTNGLEISTPVHVDHDKKRGQFTLRLNGTSPCMSWMGPSSKSVIQQSFPMISY